MRIRILKASDSGLNLVLMSLDLDLRCLRSKELLLERSSRTACPNMSGAHFQTPFRS